VTLTAAPTAQGRYASTVTVTSDATGGGSTMEVFGTATAAAPAGETRIIDVPGVNTGDIRSNQPGGAVSIGSSQSTTFNITNTGNSTLTVTDIDPGHPVFTVSPTSGTVAAGASMAVTATYTPAAAGNSFSVMLITSDATSVLRDVITLSGIGSAAPVDSTRILGLSGNLAFGEVDTSVEMWEITTPLTISNSGNSTLTVTDVTTGNSVFTSDKTAGRDIEIGAGGTATVMLTFTPAEAISYSSTLTVTSDATSGTNTSTVSGTGSFTAPDPTRVLGLSGSLAFGDVTVGSSKSLEISVSNSGNATACWGSITAPSGVTFRTTSGGNYSDGCVMSGTAVTMVVKFTPPSTGAISGTIAFEANLSHGPFTSGSVSTMALSGTGVQ